MAQVWNVIAGVLVLVLCVLVHEIGHFVSALILKIPVEEFSIGFGPKLFGFTRKGIRYSLRAVPLGGYVRYFMEEDNTTDPRAFPNQPAWKRLISTFCGPFMNVVLALVMSFCLFVTVGNLYSAPLVSQLMVDMPAEAAGMLPGDMITAANGESVSADYAGIEKLNGILEDSGANPITFTVARGDETLDITVTPEYNEEEQRLMIGLYYGYLREDCSFGQAATRSWSFMWDMMGAMIDSIRQLFTPNSGAVDQLTGPVGTVQLISQQVSQGGEYILQIIMLISLNLGMLNLLPIPGLDGAHIVFIVIEMIRRKPVPPDKESLVHLIGLGALMLLVLFVTYKDIVRIITGGTFGG